MLVHRAERLSLRGYRFLWSFSDYGFHVEQSILIKLKFSVAEKSLESRMSSIVVRPWLVGIARRTSTLDDVQRIEFENAFS